MRKELENNHVTIENSLYVPVPVTLTEKVTFFIIRGDIAVGWAILLGEGASVVYSANNIKIRDHRENFKRILKITVEDTPSEQEPQAFDFYGGDLIVTMEPNPWYGYVFLPYLNLFYLVATGKEDINTWSEMNHKFRCISAVHKLCSQLILISKNTSEEVVMQELRNLQKLVCAWTTPSNLEEFDWETEARKLLDNKVVPKIKKFAVNSNYRRIRLD